MTKTKMLTNAFLTILWVIGFYLIGDIKIGFGVAIIAAVVTATHLVEEHL